MKRIYTRRGDNGTTAIHGGARVPKHDIRIEANGTIDELNVAIGIVRAMLAPDDSRQTLLMGIQKRLMEMMSHVATPSEFNRPLPPGFDKSLVTGLEHKIDELTAMVGDSNHFLLPSGTPLTAFIHQARVVARRAERRLWSLNEVDPVAPVIVEYINRLSDLFFIMARVELHLNDVDEEPWKKFSHNRTSKSK